MNLLSVGAGGFIGAILRYHIGNILPMPYGFPFGTLMINWMGCLFLALFLTAANDRWRIHPTVQIGVGTGLIGSFTTFSALSVETVNLIRNNDLLFAFIYVLFSVFGGIALSVIGIRLARIIVKEGE